MVLLDSMAAEHVRSWLGGPRGPGMLDLHHALAYHRGGLWGDDATVPRSVLLVRDGPGPGQLEAFGAGEPGPAVDWLTRRGGRERERERRSRSVALLAPRDWWDAVGRRVGPASVERAEVVTLSVEASDFTPSSSAAATRRLRAEDRETFLASEATPAWALAGWTSFGDLIEHGAGFVVPFGPGHAAVAWVYSRAARYETVGVSTVPRFRGLGLGRAVASALVSDILQRRGGVPLWTAAPGNEASHALARSLGFSVVATETYLRWGPPPGETSPAR